MSRENTMIGRGMLASAMAAPAAALMVTLFYYAAPGMAAASGSTMVVNTKPGVYNLRASPTKTSVTATASGATYNAGVLNLNPSPT